TPRSAAAASSPPRRPASTSLSSSARRLSSRRLRTEARARGPRLPPRMPARGGTGSSRAPPIFPAPDRAAIVERMSGSPVHLGTTNSSAALFDGERVSLVRNGDGNLLTPSVVRVDARGSVTVGARARRLGERVPENVHAGFKRLMGTSRTLDFPAAGLKRKPE